VKPLLDNNALEKSSVVANCLMNRERGCAGGNSYVRELRLNPIGFLQKRLATADTAAWLDLCCGSGKALLEASEQLSHLGLAERTRLVGVDLVDMFAANARPRAGVELVAASCLAWETASRFDLITCVHGLHYIGDKLLFLQRASAWLKADGHFICHLDLNSLRGLDGKVIGRLALKSLRDAGFTYHQPRHLLARAGRSDFALPFRYLGADDQAGPNYTGQPAVNSFYDIR
jgi:SAM-dependent methyltransferase